VNVGDRIRRLVSSFPARDPAAGTGATHGAYERLARWYDWSGAIAFSDTCVSLIGDLLDREQLTPDACLDIACGTGSFGLAMMARGMRCVGIDRSFAMLAEAGTKAAARGAPLELVCADMRAFRLLRQFPLVTCFYDALNHLRETEDVAAAIATAAAHVAPGGLYVFDTNNERMFERVWAGPSETIDVGSGEVQIVYLYDRARRGGSAQVTFRRDHEEPITGWVHERCHSPSEIEAAVIHAGLEIRSRGPHPYFADAASSLKDLWICRRP